MKLLLIKVTLIVVLQPSHNGFEQVSPQFFIFYFVTN